MNYTEKEISNAKRIIETYPAKIERIKKAKATFTDSYKIFLAETAIVEYTSWIKEAKEILENA